MSIDFKSLASSALAHAEAICAELFPNGARDGAEFKVGSLSGEPGRSLSVNLRTGTWKDFSGGDSGSDLIALWGAARNIGMKEAAQELAEAIGAERLTKKAREATARGGRQTNGDWDALPFADAPTTAPTSRRIFRNDAWAEYAITGAWEYRREGKQVGWVCRVDYADGAKDLFPYTYCRNTKTNERAWRWKAFANPRPLYRLPALEAAAGVGVMIVEGEKTAEAAQRLVPGIICMAWPGGANGIHRVDLEPLRGRRVTLWPDADSQRWEERDTSRHPDITVGEVKPLTEQPGFAAMAALADRLEGIAESVVLLTPPEGKADGWDLADAEREGWTETQVRAHVRACKERAAEAAKQAEADEEARMRAADAEMEAATPPPQEPDAELPVISTDEGPFIQLGYDRSKFYFFAKGPRQVIALTASEMKQSRLLELGPLSYWSSTYDAGKGNIAWTVAADSIIRRSYAAGIYNPRRLRGRGCWIDGDSVVYHAGDRLWVDGIERPLNLAIDQKRARYVYECAEALEPDIANPATNAEAAKMRTLCESLPWKHKLDGLLLAGWCVIAPICGALHWRPHIWVNGPSGSGKSTIISDIVQRVVGPNALQVKSSTTEAGIRQELHLDAFPVLFDEAESEGKRDQIRIQSILELARQASSESGGGIIKGTANGEAMRFNCRSAFCFASIGVGAIQRADTSRITRLELRKRESTENQTAWPNTLRQIAESVAREGYCESLRARSVLLARVIRNNARVFGRCVARRLGDQRTGDQIGALLAGAYSLSSRNEVDEIFAEEWVRDQDWSAFEPDAHDADEVRAFAHLCDSHVRVEFDSGPSQTCTIGELVLDALRIDGSKRSRETLVRHGVAVTSNRDAVAISCTHQALRRMFADTPWADKWKDQMSRVAGAVQKPARFGAVVHKAVVVPRAAFEQAPAE